MTEAERITVLIADDHAIVREGTRAMVEESHNIRVVCEVSNGADAIVAARDFQPDIILMDVRMPGTIDGIEATSIIHANWPRIAILILTSHEQTDYVLEAIRAGAAGYLLKEVEADELIATIHRVVDGDSPLDAEFATRVLKRIAKEERTSSMFDAAHDLEPFERLAAGDHLNTRTARLDLSERELEILSYMTRGLTNAEIADRLTVSHHTIKGHVSRIIRKMGVADRTQAAVKAVRLNLIRPSD